jgi:ferrous iron transport protein B
VTSFTPSHDLPQPAIYLVGNPNCGKTSLFNALTGERQHVGNWPGITVERLEGKLAGDQGSIRVVDLPGAYSLTPLTPEEGVVRQVLDEAWEGVVVDVVDATTLERNLFLTLQLRELGFRPVIALNCMDALAATGASLDPAALARQLDCPVFPTVARTGEGVDALRQALPGLLADRLAALSPRAASPGKPRLVTDRPSPWAGPAQERGGGRHRRRRGKPWPTGPAPAPALADDVPAGNGAGDHGGEALAGSARSTPVAVPTATSVATPAATPANAPAPPPTATPANAPAPPPSDPAATRPRSTAGVIDLPPPWQAALTATLAWLGHEPATATPSQRLAALQALVEVRSPSRSPALQAIQERLAAELARGTGRPLSVAALPCELAADRYRRIGEVLAGCYRPAPAPIDPLTARLDRVLAHPWWGLPLFGLMMAVVFWSTFSLGALPAAWVEEALAWATEAVEARLADSLLRDLLVDGVLAGVGGVLVFLPNIAILFFWLALLEDSGYLARAAFLMDYFMQKMGLHGRAFVPLLMGFGCNVPAILATRIIEHPWQRRLAMLLMPLVGCSARLPVLVLLCGTFFPDRPGTMLFLIYLINLLVLFAIGRAAASLGGPRSTGLFLLEMPPYRLPTWRTMRGFLWEKIWHFIEKAGTVILLGSILIWVLSAFPREVPLSRAYDAEIARLQATPSDDLGEAVARLVRARDQERLAGRWMSRLGRALHPLVAPLGFGWREAVSLIPGFLAKEGIVSTLAVLYGPVDDDLGAAMRQEGMTPLGAFAFMLFTLLYVPCLSTLGVLWRESGSWGFTALALVFPAMLAWIVGFIVYQGGLALQAWAARPGGYDLALVVLLALGSAVLLVRRAWCEVRGGGCAGCPSRATCARSRVEAGGSCEKA